MSQLSYATTNYVIVLCLSSSYSSSHHLSSPAPSTPLTSVIQPIQANTSSPPRKLAHSSTIHTRRRSPWYTSARTRASGLHLPRKAELVSFNQESVTSISTFRKTYVSTSSSAASIPARHVGDVGRRPQAFTGILSALRVHKSAYRDLFLVRDGMLT
ncbi:hypothetical protein BDQ17DRAFT_1419080 [Cyathus striatus]|nr:hypothetical protein BDQ17DRAFT_1419080 [Cyathus striatus]